MADRPDLDRQAARTFLVEHYRSRERATGLPRAADRACTAAERLTNGGTPVRLLGSLYVPEDESLFLLYEGISPEAVVEAALDAAIAVERVVEAVQIRLAARAEAEAQA